MKALTLLQPWATLVAIGAKKIETRSWSTAYRGPLAIHAAKRVDKKALKLCFQDPFFYCLMQAGIQPTYHLLKGHTLPHGYIVATCELVAVFKIDEDFALPAQPELSFGDYTTGRFAWFLDDIKELSEPIPAQGKLGLWNLGGSGMHT